VRALFLLVAACTRTVDALPTHEIRETSAVEAPRAECRIDGTASLDAGAQLYGGGDVDQSFAHFNGRSASVTVHEVPTMAVDRVGLRASTKSGFALDGWVDRNKIPFATKVRVPLAGDVAWIPRGTAVTVKLGEGKKVVAALTPKHLAPVEALVACEQLAIGHVEPDRPVEEVGELFNLAGDRLAISATRDGPPVFTLRPKNTSFTISAEDTGDGMRVRYQDGIAIDGWVAKSALKPITSMSGISCSCCGGMAHGIFPFAGPVQLATARRASTIGVGEKAPGIVRGHAAAGAELIVLEEVSDYARVVPRCREMLAHTAFWIARRDLDIGSPVNNGLALERACR
jgi:hypothetical protein